jgi:signal transduction histidine kinase
VAWLAGCLETRLATALIEESDEAGGGEIGQRLPALVFRLANYELRLVNFETRLEHEKLEAMKELAYGASHEINNPLANIAARAQTLLQDESDPERGRKLAAIHRQAMRAHEMIADLMLFARPPKLNLGPCDVCELVQQVVGELTNLAKEQDTQLACDRHPQPLVLEADATQLAVAVHAVIVNALEALGDGGSIEIGVGQIDSGGSAWAEITIRDDGPGISDEVRRHLFDPFFSGREAGRGLGFGLSKCWRIVTDHGGQVTLHQPAGGGAEVAIRLPLARDSSGGGTDNPVRPMRLN